MTTMGGSVFFSLCCIIFVCKAQPFISLSPLPLPEEDNFYNINTSVNYTCATNGTRLNWVISGRVSLGDGLQLRESNVIGTSDEENGFVITVTNNMPFTTSLTIQPSHNLTNATIECHTTDGVNASRQYMRIMSVMGVTLDPHQDSSESFGTFGQGTVNIDWVAPDPMFAVEMYEASANKRVIGTTRSPTIDVSLPIGTHVVNITPINVFEDRGISHPVTVVSSTDTEIIGGVAAPSVIAFLCLCGLVGVVIAYVFLYKKYHH